MTFDMISKCMKIISHFWDSRTIAVWGMGNIGNQCVNWIRENEKEHTMNYFDSIKKKYQSTQCLNRKNQEYFVIVTMLYGYDCVRNQLKQYGYEEYKDYLCIGKIFRDIEEFDDTNRNPIYVGNYSTWNLAQKDCEGYQGDDIIKVVSASALAVKNGLASYERDGVLFYEETFNLPLCAWLMRAAANNKNRLDVLDFGGSLGSTYYQNRNFFKNIDVSWNIKEQSKFVEIGKKMFENSILHFYDNIDDIFNCNSINVCLFSSVLQYIPDYRNVIIEAISKNPQFIIVERIPMGNIFVIRKEIVKKPIYEATYPAIFFNEKEILKIFENNGYSIASQWESMVGNTTGCREYFENSEYIYKSFAFERMKR